MPNLLTKIFSPQVFRDTLLRFPLALSSIFAAAVLSIIAIHGSDADPTIIYIITRLLFIFLVGFPLFAGIHVYSEQQKLGKNRLHLLQGLGLIFLALLFFAFPQDPYNFALEDVFRIFLIVLALSLIAITAPFIKTQESQGLWQFTWKIFLRAVISGIFAGVIFVGIALALGGINFLLQVEVPGELFGDVWILAGLVFAPWFWLGGVPKDYAELESDTSYPKLLEIFTQFILLPLTTVYLVILYAYGLRVLFTGDWPEGQTVYIIISFVIPSLLTAKLLFPKRETSWVKWVLRAIYGSVLPLMYLYFSAIWFRVDDFGLTTDRYLVILLGVWIVGICLYYLISKQKLLKVAPISAAILLLLASFGPWSAFELPKTMQLNRLATILTENQILVDGQMKTASDNEVSTEEAADITGLVEYS